MRPMATKRKRRRFTGEKKAKIAVEALREQKTLAEIASMHECHPNQVTKWKKDALDGLPLIFSGKPSDRSEEKLIAGLYEQIGRLKVELEWLKKKWAALS